MAETLKPCPTCEGRGVYDSKPIPPDTGPTMEFECYACDGKGTLSMPLDEGLVEVVAQKIYANVHHLMRVTGTEAQTAYEAAARSIIKEIATRAAVFGSPLV